MLRVMRARCVARDFHTIAPLPVVRVEDSSRRNEEIVTNLKLRLSMRLLLLLTLHNFRGLLVKASVSSARELGLAYWRIIPMTSKLGILVAALPSAWCSAAYARVGWPDVDVM